MPGTIALVVDDELSIQVLLRDWLTEENDLRVLTASTGIEAERILRSEPVDVLLVDLRLQECTGLDVIKRARALQPHIVPILMTGYPTLETAIGAVQTDIYDYLVKPFRMELLSATVRRAVEQRQLQRENMALREQLAVAELIRKIGTTQDSEEIIEAVLATVREEFDAAAVALLMFNPERGRLELRGIRGDQVTIQKPSYAAFLNGETVATTAVMAGGCPIVYSSQQGDLFDDPCLGADCITQPLTISGRTVGVLNMVRRPNCAPCGDGTLRTLSLISAHAAASIDNARLYRELHEAYLDTVSALANAIEIRDPYTRGHTDRVKTLARAIAARLKWSAQDLFNLWMGCTLHDIGKLGVPDEILGKPGPLTDDEFAVMKTHPEIGVRLVEGVPFLRAAVPYIYSHHERFDGTGYPTGAAGENIPIEGRILAVVDAFDAIISNRPYRPGQPVEAAIAELKMFSGIQFDPCIVDIFLDILASRQFPWIVTGRPSAPGFTGPANGHAKVTAITTVPRSVALHLKSS